ncbi:MAG: glycosyltransferase family 2 protein [Syntrophobacterales bacterium]|jgi:glycosyltransferase involved in cell wall biosynthesis|nr:glycosyltransferase family 2 protein [Syntrophobacterales bacterium]
MQFTKDGELSLQPEGTVCDLSIIAPMYNEQNNIDYFFEKLLPILNNLNMSYEIICINDGSTDNTLEELLKFRQDNPFIKIINFSRNFGKEIALTAGLRYSRGQAMIPIDADLQDPPELIERLIAKWRENYDVVYAVRETRHGETLMKRLTANLFYRFINCFSETPIPKNTGDFRLLDRRVVEVLNHIPERTRFMKGLFAWVGFRQTGISFERQPRHLGTTKWSFWKLWNFALDGITLFSTAGLKFWSYVGIVISMLSFAYALFLISLVLFFGRDVPGYASIMVAILFLGGLQLISLGILGEYLGRVYAEVKHRPLYIISDSYGFEDSETK